MRISIEVMGKMSSAFRLHEQVALNPSQNRQTKFDIFGSEPLLTFCSNVSRDSSVKNIAGPCLR